ncbi:hypothetical protein ACIQNG_10820 [Streptomyces sp. NPDC091377]|uniref:VMAP-C domain-containing protein n=1 Tax=unclassified Streptomyces TaxID=2593676 RepID=UPI003806C80F
MGTGAEHGAPDASGGALRLSLRLTEALCELSCMDDAPGRAQFALVLGEQLAQPVDVRGVRQRADVIDLVRAALSVGGGEHVLIGVVELFEGAAAADKLERLLPQPEQPVSVVPPGPLTGRDESTARALLADPGAALSAGGLRDELARELNGLYLPPGLTPEQLFEHVLQWNVQVDGVPPAVVLVDLAARQSPASRHRADLTRWVDGWARERPGLTEAVAARRDRRAAAVFDPDIPQCLVIAVEPARDGTDEIAVRTWLNAVPGHWDPRPADPVVTTLDALGEAVQEAFRASGPLWADRRETQSAGRVPPLYIEFVLPYDLLNHDVARIRLAPGDGRPLPIGPRFGVHLRSLERMRTDDRLVRAQWRERWQMLRERGIVVHGWSEPDADRPDAWQMALAGETRHTAVVLDSPAGGSAREALKTAIAEGIGLAIWDRRGVFEAARRETVTAVFASVVMPGHLPRAIRRWRYEAEQRESHDVGRHIGFFWDDPTRQVDIHPRDPDLPDPLDPLGTFDPVDHDDLAS